MCTDAHYSVKQLPMGSKVLAVNGLGNWYPSGIETYIYGKCGKSVTDIKNDGWLRTDCHNHTWGLWPKRF